VAQARGLPVASQAASARERALSYPVVAAGRGGSRISKSLYTIENTRETSPNTANRLRGCGRVILEKSLATHRRVFWPRFLPDL